MVDVCLFAIVLFAYSLISRRLEGTIVTAPMVFLAAGLVLGPGVTGLVDLHIGNDAVLVMSAVTLAILLFTDAVRIDLAALLRNETLPARLLGIGMPLSIIAGGAAALIVPGLTIWEAATIGAVLAPTDVALAQTVVTNPLVPARIRQVLSVEAGLNDGLCVPFLSVFLSLVRAEETHHPLGYWLIFAAQQIGFGLLTGAGIGLAGGWLMAQATRRDWMSSTFQQLGLVALSLTAYILAGGIGGNGFIAAFVAGLVIGSTIQDAGHQALAFAEGVGQLLSLGVVFVFGAFAGPLLGRVTWQVILYAILSLTVVRMVPVALALVGTRLQGASVLFMGWFGPRGLASIILGLIAWEQVHTATVREQIALTMTMTVLLSVFAHGMTAAPVSGRYACRIKGLPPESPEWAQAAEAPTRAS
jgi:NhaP-type Na+/H+ or K+/H+ antiporter